MLNLEDRLVNDCGFIRGRFSPKYREKFGCCIMPLDKKCVVKRITRDDGDLIAFLFVSVKDVYVELTDKEGNYVSSSFHSQVSPILTIEELNAVLYRLRESSLLRDQTEKVSIA